MRHILQKIGICGALIIALPASALPYYLILKTVDDEKAAFYDAGSVIKDGPNIQVWIKLVFNEKPRPALLPYQMLRFSIDCKKLTLQVLTWAKYANGKLIGSASEPNKVETVVPHTFGAAVSDAACHPGFPLKFPYSLGMEKSLIENGTVFKLFSDK